MQEAEPDGVPEENVAASLADEEVGIKRGDGHEGTADAENLHQPCALNPFFRDEDSDELWRDERQSEERRTRHESREAQHLPKGA